MKLWSKVLPAAAFLTVAATSVDALAAPMRVPGGGRGFHQGAYIYGSPLIVYFPIEDDEFADLDPSWQWTFGGGYMWTIGPIFKIQFGGAFEHAVLNFDDIDNDDVRGNILRFYPEVRIGGGNNVIWGYGLLGTGLGLTIVDVDFGGVDETETDPGFALQIGGGVQGAVWRSLFIGGELDFDLGFYDGDSGDFNTDDYEIHSLGLKATIGWVF